MTGVKFVSYCGEVTRVMRVASGFVLFFFAVAGVSAQVRSSTITGTVTDPSGAVVPKAVVTVSNQRTNLSVKTYSGASGLYSVPFLPNGLYSVTVAAPGFRTLHIHDITVGTGLTVQEDVKLRMGATSQVIQVQASAAHLQTQNAAVVATIPSQIIHNVPNITENPLYYATLAAGAVPSPSLYSGNNLGVGYQDRQQFSAIRVNGGMIGTNNVMLDGVPIQGAGWHSITVVPNQDALEAVTVHTNNLPANLGGGQAIISMETKSGTNHFHGDLYYKQRNEIFNANGFANDLQGIPRAKFRVDQGGGSIGGPIIVPGLFNGENKIFFFAAFTRATNEEPFSGFTRVPTALQRQGNFSQTMIADQNGNPVHAQIYNPYEAVPVQGSTGTFVRPLYPNAIVTEPDPFGLKLLQAFPAPNHAPSDAFDDNNYFYSGESPTTRNTFNSRLDFHFGRNAFFAAGGVENGSTIGVNAWGNSSPWSHMSSPDFTDDNPYGAIGDIITLSPTMFLDFHAGLQRVSTQAQYPNQDKFSSPSDYSAYGMPTSVQSLIAIPGVAPSTYSLGYGSSLNNAQWVWKNQHETNWDFSGSMSKVVGKWTLQDGVQYHLFLSNWADKEWATPSLAAYVTECYCEQYGFISGNADSSLNVTPQQNGFAGAQAAIGAMGYRLDAGTTTEPALAEKNIAFWTEDNFRPTPRLTVNLGLRYSIQPGPTERHNREYSLNLNVSNPFAAGGANPLAGMGAFAFPGTSGYSRNLWNTEYSDIAPRVGMAFELGDHTVIRGGYGRIYEPSNTGFNANGMIYGGGAFVGGTVMTPYGTNPSTGRPVGRFEDASNTEIIGAPGAVQSPELYGNENGSAGVDYFLRNGYHNAYMDQWNVFVQHRFHGWLTSIGYVGSRGSHLGWRQFPLNGPWQVPQTLQSTWRQEWIASNGVDDPGQTQVPNPMPALIGRATGDSGNTTIPAVEAQEAYLGLLGQTVYASKGSSLYNSMQLSLGHSFSSGLIAQFDYVWSSSTGTMGGAGGATYAEDQQGTLAPAGGIDYVNLQNNNGILGSDVPQRFVAVASYALPFGPSNRRFTPGNPIVRALASGWRLSTVVTLQSGQPWGPNCSGTNISGTINTNGTTGGSLNERCIPTGQPLQVPKSLQHWYDGSTTVTLPDGRRVTPGQYTYLKWNPDAFTSQIVQFPNGSYSVNKFWSGTTPQFIGALRMPSFQNVNLDISRSFQIHDHYTLEIMAQATNLFNHTNFLPDAVNNSFSSPILVPSGTGAVGENGNPNAGTLSLDTMDPREMTLTARFRF